MKKTGNGKETKSMKTNKIDKVAKKPVNMGKGELVDAVAEKTGTSKKVSAECLDATIEVIKEQLKKGNKITLIGFGTFEIATRAAREGVNPLTKEKIKIKASKAPKFKVSKTFKDSLN